jgi:hypothetical protein
MALCSLGKMREKGKYFGDFSKIYALQWVENISHEDL